MALIRRFLIAPNNKLYVEFLNNSMIEGLPCLLAEIERDSGIPKCIERDTDFRFLGVGQDPRVFCDCPEERPLRNDIQFDKIGNIYYSGIPGTWIKDSPNSKVIGTGPTSCAASPCRMASVVRRFSNGAIRDFGLAAIGKGGVDEAWRWPTLGSAFILRPILNFLVLENGNILIHANRDLIRAGTPECPLCYQEPRGTDLWSSTGQILASDLPTGASALLLTVDSKRVIMQVQRDGVRQANYFEVIVDEVGTVRSSPLGGTVNGDFSVKCRGFSEDNDFQRFACIRGSSIRHYWRTPSGEIFIVAGQDPFSKIESYNNRPEMKDVYDALVKYGAKYGSGVLIRLFPSEVSTRVGLPQDSQDLNRIETFASSLDEFYASGLIENGQRQTIVFNTGTNTSTVLIPTSSDIRVTKMAFSAKNNSLLFVGVQGSLEKPIFGLIDRLTKKLVVTSFTGSVSDLQTYSS